MFTVTIALNNVHLLVSNRCNLTKFSTMKIGLALTFITLQVAQWMQSALIRLPVDLYCINTVGSESLAIWSRFISKRILNAEFNSNI